MLLLPHIRHVIVSERNLDLEIDHWSICRRQRCWSSDVGFTSQFQGLVMPSLALEYLKQQAYGIHGAKRIIAKCYSSLCNVLLAFNFCGAKSSLVMVNTDHAHRCVSREAGWVRPCLLRNSYRRWSRSFSYLSRYLVLLKILDVSSSVIDDFDIMSLSWLSPSDAMLVRAFERAEGGSSHQKGAVLSLCHLVEYLWEMFWQL